MIIKFVMKFLPTCLPSGLTVAAPDALGRIPGVILCMAMLKTVRVTSKGCGLGLKLARTHINYRLNRPLYF